MDPLEGEVVMTGGVVAYNPVIVDLVSEVLGREVLVPDHPQYTGALGAALIGTTSLGFLSVLLLTAFGSALGFLLMYLVGHFFGEKILRKGKLKFVTPEALSRLDRWFSRYGYGLIVANRFLAGTRSAISFFSGVHRLRPGRTFACASLSALLWNAVIIYIGMKLGNRVDLIDRLLSRYNRVILGLILAVVVVVVIRYLIRFTSKSD
jgi:membrane protein DedA with SNARE-associated domain